MRIVCIQSPKFDFLTSTLIEGLIELGHTIISTESSNYAIKSSKHKVRLEAEIADLVLVFSNEGVDLSVASKIENKNIIYIDGDDSQNLTAPRDIRFKAIFKREYSKYWVGRLKDPIFPLPFAAERRYFTKRKGLKDYDVTFLATMHTPFRQAVAECLKAKNLKKSIVGNTNEQNERNPRRRGLQREAPRYREILGRSLISINVIGGGYDCGRYWEILAAGSMLFTQQLDIVIPNQFEHLKHCVTFRSLDELGDQLDYLLAHPTLIHEIQHSGYNHLLKHHTTVERAKYFLDTMEGIGDGEWCASVYDPVSTARPKFNEILNNRFVEKMLNQIRKLRM